MEIKDLEPLLFTSVDVIPTIDEKGKMEVTIVDTNRYPEGLNCHEVNSEGKVSETIMAIISNYNGKNVLLCGKPYKMNQRYYQLNLALLKDWIERTGKNGYITSGFNSLGTSWTETFYQPSSELRVSVDIIFNHYDIHPLVTYGARKDLRKLKSMWRKVKDGELTWVHSPFGSWAFSTKSEYYDEIAKVAKEKGSAFVKIPEYFVAENPQELEEYARQILQENGRCIVKSNVGYGGSAKLITDLAQLKIYTKTVSRLNTVLVERPARRQLVEIQKRGADGGYKSGSYAIDLVQLVVAKEPISCVIKVSPGSIEEDIRNYLPAQKKMTFVFPQVEEFVVNDSMETHDDKEAKIALRNYELKKWLEMSRVAGEIGYEAMNRVVKRKEENWEAELQEAVEKAKIVRKLNLIYSMK